MQTHASKTPEVCGRGGGSSKGYFSIEREGGVRWRCSPPSAPRLR